MSNLNDLAIASAEQEAIAALEPIAAELGITDLSGIKNVNDLYERWIGNTRDVPIMSLLNMGVQAGAMALDGKWGDALANFGDKKLEMIADKLVQATIIFGDAMASDPEMQAAVANLSIVRNVIFPIIEGVTTAYATVEGIVEKVEPTIPYVEILVRALRMWWLPTEGPAIANESTKLALKELSKILRLLYADLKTWIIEEGISIPVPEVLLGLAGGILDPSYSLDSLVEDALTAEGIGDVNDNNWLDANGDFSGTNFVKGVTGNNPPAWAANSLAFLNNNKSFGVAALSWFSDYYENLAEQAEYEETSSEHDPVKSPVKAIDVVRDSQDILDLFEKIDNMAYSNGMMMKMGCDKLREDGAVVNYADLSYDEKATQLGGNSLRKRFHDLNNTINGYHDIIKVLSGEIRFNFTEKIPVIDFFKNTFSLQKYYDENDPRHTTVNTLEQDVKFSELYNREEDAFHEASINLALNGSAFKETIYNDDMMNLVVDSNVGGGTTVAPPYLAGKFAREDNPYERDDNNKIKTWYVANEVSVASNDNDAAIISRGTLYNPYFLDETGTYVLHPLSTSNPSYGGYAEELKTELDSNIANFKSTYSNPAWATSTTVKLSNVFYNNQKGSITGLTGPLGNLTTALSAWDAHFEGSVFRISDDSSDKVKRYAYDRSKRDRGDSAADLIAKISAVEARSQGLETQFDLNSFAMIKIIQAGSQSSRYNLISAEIRTPYDILLYAHAMTRRRPASSLSRRTFMGSKSPSIRYTPITSVNADSFLYSGTEFKTLTKTRTVRTKVKSRAGRFSRWVRGKSKYKSTTIVETVGASQAKDPVFYLVSKVPVSGAEVGQGLFFFGRKRKYGQFTRRSRFSFRRRYKYVNSVIGFKIMLIQHFQRPTSVTYNTGFEELTTTSFKGGTECYVYKLQNITLNTGSEDFNFSPFCSPLESFVVSKGSKSMLWSQAETLKSFLGKAGLPQEVNNRYTGRILPNNVINVSVLNKMLGSATVANYIRDKIMEKPLIVDVDDDEVTIVNLEQSIIIFKTMAKYAGLIATFPVANAPVLQKYKVRWQQFADELTILKELDTFTTANVQALDRLFGDTYVEGGVTKNVAPWIEIENSSSPMFVRLDLFAQLSAYMVEQLEGLGNVPVQRQDDGPAEGSPASLYYRRYLVANQRMNKYSGPLYQAITLEKASNIFTHISNNFVEQLEIIRETLDTLPVSKNQKVVFVNGKFIDNSKYDMVRKGIGDHCLLTCGTCHVKYSCPYYNEQEVILTMLDGEETLSVYLKDNMLNLVSRVITGGEDRTEEYKTYHNPYAEIENGDVSVRLIDDAIEDINDIQATFIDDSGSPYDNMGWVTKARYGTVNIIDENNFKGNKYLYDAIFIDDEESYFSYGSSQKFTIGNTTVNVREANAISAFSENDEIYLVSDDGYDPIYLGIFKDIGFEIQNPQCSDHYANAYINMDDYTNPNQAWCTSYKYKGITYPGRKREKTRIELIGDGSFTRESILAGKPNLRNYINFAREVKIPINKIQWTLSGTRESILEAKKNFPFFETNLRLVNVKK